jgi:hypothetical protein
MKSKYLHLLFLIAPLLAFINGIAQNQSKVAFTGIGEITLGTDFKTISRMLEPKADYNFAYRLSAEIIKKRGENPDDYYIPGLKRTYKLKRNNLRYFTFWDRPVQKIEITFDTTNKVKEILLFCEKNEATLNMFIGKATAEFGEASCSNGLDPNREGVVLSTYCFWLKTDTKFSVSDFYGNAPEAMPADHVWVEFSLR